MRFHHPWRLSLLRPSFISHGQPHVPLWSDHDDRPESDDEIFHQTSKSERRVLFHTRITVSVDEMGGSWDDYRVLRVLRVVRWIFSNRPFVLATRASVGDDVAVSRGESVREENSEEGATVTRLMLMLVFWCARVRFVFHGVESVRSLALLSSFKVAQGHLLFLKSLA
jgi:hypothetical protein